jgi:hypothetical protein
MPPSSAFRQSGQSDESLAEWEAAFDARCDLWVARIDAALERGRRRYVRALLLTNGGLWALTLVLCAVLVVRYG